MKYLVIPVDELGEEGTPMQCEADNLDDARDIGFVAFPKAVSIRVETLDD